MPTNRLRHGVLWGALLLSSCDTMNQLAPVPPPDLRIWVTAQGDYPSTAEAMIRVRNLAKVPTREEQELGAGRYRLVLVCPDAAACRAAAQRIADDRSFALGVDVENPTSRQRIPVKPTRAQSR